MKKRAFGLMAATVALFAFAAGCTDAGQGTTQEVTEETAEGNAEANTEGTSESTTEGQIRVGSLKGPTTMGLVNLMKDSENGESLGNYSFTMETDASVLMASMISGDIDIALVPANMASVMYNKTAGIEYPHLKIYQNRGAGKRHRHKYTWGPGVCDRQSGCCIH